VAGTGLPFWLAGSYGTPANVGLGQVRRATGYLEEPLVTLGSDLNGVRAMLQRHPDGWSAAQAVAWLLGRRSGGHGAAPG
jgi:hypothetical protein